MPDFFTNIVSESYTNIVPENWINTVPESCCNLPLLRSQGDNCSDIVAIMSTDDIVANRIYNQVYTTHAIIIIALRMNLYDEVTLQF